MTDIIGGLAGKLRGSGNKVVFVECEDERILRAARKLADEGICVPVLLGSPGAIVSRAEELDISLEGIAVFNAEDGDKRARFAQHYHNLVPDIPEKRLLRKMGTPLQYAAMLVKVGYADCLAAGVVHSTGEVIVAAQQFIGLEEGVEHVSSIGYVDLRIAGGDTRWVGISDCAVNASPDADTLADTALSSAQSYRRVFGSDPRVAMLSYSTCGSADDEPVRKVRQAVQMANARNPKLLIDGEFQLEVALVPELAERKLNGRASDVAGRADVLVFPNLDAGNIAVKCMQLFGGFGARGPILQGFARPVTDFSRSANTEEVYGNVVLALSMGGTQ